MPNVMNRLTRDEAAEFIGCSISKLYAMEKAGLLNGTFYQIGRRRLYITSKLEEWIMRGGELEALERKRESGNCLQ